MPLCRTRFYIKFPGEGRTASQKLDHQGEFLKVSASIARFPGIARLELSH